MNSRRKWLGLYAGHEPSETKVKTFSEIRNSTRISKALKDLHPEAEDIKLYLWQENAVQRWAGVDPDLQEKEKYIQGRNVEEDKPFRGIVQAITGAGKTILAIECMMVWLQQHPSGFITILVPTRALQKQWRSNLQKVFEEPIGVLGGGRRNWRQINIATMDTASKGLPETSPDHLIIADECHNLGSPGRRYAVLNNKHSAILGISATPRREDSGLAVVSYLCGPVVFRYGFTQGREDGVIMPFTVRAVTVPLTPEDKRDYVNLTNTIKSMMHILKGRYGSETNFFTIPDHECEDGLLSSFKNVCTERKRLVNQTYHRFSCVNEILRMHRDLRCMLFHERIHQLEWMHDQYCGNDPVHLPDLQWDELNEEWFGTPYEDTSINPPDCSEWLEEPALNPTIYHGEMGNKEKDADLENFKAGKSRLLMSCKALREGLDVPDADLGIMVSGTNATRARIQTLGRCLRKGDGEKAIVYILYIGGTTDTKGLTNLKYNGQLPSGTIEYWSYDGRNLKFVEKDVDEMETDDEREARAKRPKTRDHICKTCHKEFFTEETSKPENHNCTPLRTKRGRKAVNIWKNLRKKK